MRIIELTESLCSVCLRKLDAEIIEENRKIYISKICPEHGAEKALIWSDASSFRGWEENSAYAPKYENGSRAVHGCPYDCGYCEDHRGTTCTAVIEVTDRCNMGCPVCFAAADASKGSDRSIEKIKEMICYVAETQGFCSLQLSGGEPTLRDDLPEVISYAKGLGFKHIQLNTNGIRLAGDYDYVLSLKEAGADLVYLGFDGVSDNIYRSLRKRDMLEVKKGCIENCRKSGIGVMLVPVIVKNINDHQIGQIVDFAKKNMPVVKGIHFQPVSKFGRYELGDSLRDADARYTVPDLFSDLKEQTEICPCSIIPRKKKSAYCSFSGSYYLDFNNKLVPLTKRDNTAVSSYVPSNSDKSSKAAVSSAGSSVLKLSLSSAAEHSNNAVQSDGCCCGESSAASGLQDNKVSSDCCGGDSSAEPKLKPAEMHAFARKTNDFTEKFWKQNGSACNGLKGLKAPVKSEDSTDKRRKSRLAEFSSRVETYSLSISGMPFQDAGNIDLNRVRNCCVSVIDESLKAIPLCLYYLTDSNGNRLYREGKCTVV